MKLNVSIAQIDVVRSQPDINLGKGEALIKEAARRGSELICFPEMWTTGFDWASNDRQAAKHERCIDQIGEWAKSYGIWINGSMLAINEEGKVTNTSILFSSKGDRVGIYRKAHLFSLIHENEHMAPGTSLCVVDTPWGRTGLSICYDIRFPELFRTYALKGAKLVLLPAAFPYPRLEHWKVLMRARAIENQMFMIGVNQVGIEDLGAAGNVTYFGGSTIVDPWGRTIVEAGETDAMLLSATIDLDWVDDIRNSMKVLTDRRPELYELA